MSDRLIMTAGAREFHYKHFKDALERGKRYREEVGEVSGDSLDLRTRWADLGKERCLSLAEHRALGRRVTVIGAGQFRMDEPFASFVPADGWK